MGYKTILCPFCTSTNIDVSPWGKYYYAECNDCEARGPKKSTLKAAIDGWNDRWSSVMGVKHRTY